MMEIGAVWSLAGITVVLAWRYFRTCALPRPPLGTVNLGDIAITLVFVIVLPFLYLLFPGWLVVTMLALTALSALWFVVEPLTTSSMARWGAAGGLVIAELLLARLYGTASPALLLVNNVVMLVMVVGVSNLWAQGGLRARHLAIFAGAIAVYDLLATGVFPLTTDMIGRLADFPFMPMMVWPAGNGQWTGIGLGDLLMAAVGPLVIRKAYGRASGLTAMAIALGAIAGVMIIARWDAMPETFPTMIVLGPLMVAHYLWLSRRYGPERTYARYVAEDPVPARPAPGVSVRVMPRTDPRRGT